MTEHDELRLLGVAELARVLGTDKSNVRRWIDAGELPCLWVGDGFEPRVNRVMLKAWLEHRAVNEQAPRARKRRTA